MIATRHWLIALCLAMLLHLTGFALVMAQTDSDDGARDQGEQGIEIDLGMLGDLGAEAVTHEAAQARLQPEPEPEPVAQPIVEPEPVTPRQQAEVRTEPKPEPKARPEPEPEPAPLPEPQSNPAPKPEPNPAAETANLDTPAQRSSRKATTGSGNAASAGGNPGAQRTYYAALAAHLARHKRYPAASRRRGEEGVVRLFFEIDRNGAVLHYRITGSSGHERLDAAVLKMLESAAPLPAFPPDMGQARLSVNVPIAFAINDRR
ncbi:hypothetical protein GCM10011348_31920 [Marinobacterium nitratireducens]|uniref:Protein TonB n=1 Tax=Marinobacterium nitratireducens TaxID=518897 RepID=A0A917ZM14_9GAMM|nr:energy transducer TonB [Marinobacterium nitratireducens]GGO84819.1 hypothetical protein GCM10011348_31920 [Marinobacterium nitratireducens]